MNSGNSKASHPRRLLLNLLIKNIYEEVKKALLYHILVYKT